ncbi:MAG: type II toxin-antitoxin system RelE/ParE family toxin [Ruminococcaceae bacterium]|nr:type II toxin-antitoxin system RelE/ParE family toxin [Oscillospiraceae bacterium]
MHNLRYTPFFNRDLDEAIFYIANTLNNPQAAERLLTETEKAILKRLENPLAFEPYHSKKIRKDTYYRIYVGNYTIFYVVTGNIMEVRRFIYSKRDFDRLL